MKRMFHLSAAGVFLLAGWTDSAVAQTTIQTEGDVEAQSFIGGGSQVTGVDAQLLDGLDSSDFALDTDLTSAETMLIALQAQVNALGLALVPRSGQATCYDAAGAVVACGTGIGQAQDGDLELGVTWPNPRFADNGNGTVTDNLSGLVWLQDANCAEATMLWAEALTFANTLFDGSSDHNGGDCGLSDASLAGAWRLPHRLELESLLDLGFFEPALSNAAGTAKWSEGDVFSGVEPSNYWSSTTQANNTGHAWNVYFYNGSVDYSSAKTSTYYVWPVRGGQ